MSSRIRGITIELNGDTTNLEDSLRDVTRQSNNLTRELKDVDKLLKFNPGNAELLAQKQELLNQRIATTSERLGTLRAAQSQVEQQFQSGELGEEAYRRFQREIITTEGSLNGLRNQLQRLTDEQERVADSTRQLGTFFQATGTDIEQFSDALGSDLTRAIRNGTATSQQLEQALGQIGQAALGSEADLGRMRSALRTIDSGGDLASIGQDLLEIERNANEAESAVRDFGGELSQTIGGIVAGGGIAGVVNSALDTSSLNTRIEITFDVPEESKQSVKTAIKDVGTYGIDAEEALEGVRRQWALNKDASDEANAAVVKGAALIASNYAAIDFTELVQEANEIGAALNISNEEALGMVNTLLKMGFPPEQLDIIAEYGEQLAIAGYNAEEVQNILAASVETKSWNIDNLLDGLKEAKIGLSEFGNEIPKVLDDLLKKTDISAEQMKTWGAAVAKGGEEGSLAMVEVAKALAGVEDATLRNELGVQVFGTKFEDQGMKLVDTLLVAEQGTANLGEGIQQLNDGVATMDADPAVKLQDALANMMTALQPILTKVAEMVTKFATWAAENPKLTATITAISTVFGILFGVFAALAPIISVIISSWGAIKVAMLAAAGPIGIIIGVIGLLIAAGIALYKNWDTVVKYWKIAIAAIKVAIDIAFKAIQGTINGVINVIRGKINEFNNFRSIVQNAVTGIWNGVKSAFSGMVNSIGSAMNNVRSTITGVWNGVMSFFRGINLSSIGSNMIKGLISGVKSMASSLVSSVKGVVTGAIDAAKSVLKIRSPSRVFMEMGEFTNEGFIKGIENTSNQLKNTMSDVYGNVAYNANRSLGNQKTSGQVNRTNSAIKQPSFTQKQPALIQLVLEDGRAVAETLVSDITQLQTFNSARITKF